MCTSECRGFMRLGLVIGLNTNSGSGSEPPRPTTISGLNSFFDVNLSTLTPSSPSDGTNLTGITDLSGASIIPSMTQVGANVVPKYKASGINGKPDITWSNSCLGGSATAVASTAVTLFAIAQWT